LIASFPSSRLAAEQKVSLFMTVDPKESRASWFIAIIAVYAGMVATGGLAVATVSLAVIAAVFALTYVVGELLGKEGYDLPAHRKSRYAARQGVVSSDAPNPTDDSVADDRAA
jgi:hypothetical protein